MLWVRWGLCVSSSLQMKATILRATQRDTSSKQVSLRRRPNASVSLLLEMLKDDVKVATQDDFNTKFAVAMTEYAPQVSTKSQFHLQFISSYFVDNLSCLCGVENSSCRHFHKLIWGMSNVVNDHKVNPLSASVNPTRCRYFILFVTLSHPPDNAKESLALMPLSKARERLMLRALNRYGTGPDGCAQAWLSLPHSMRVFYPHAYCSRSAARGITLTL